MFYKETEKRVATGVYVRTSKKGVQSIRLEFCYRKKLCRETLKLNPTTKNINHAIKLREKIIEAMTLGIFNYAKFFSDSKNAVKFGHVEKPVLMSQFFNQFLEEAKLRLQFSTYNRYERVCKKHLWDWLRRFTCQRKTVRNILTSLRAVVSEGLIYGYLEHDPLRFINLNRLKHVKSTYVVNPFNKQEIQALLSAAEAQVKNLFRFAFYTGVRISELMGLRWEDINWTKGVIRVRRAVVNGMIKRTKTASSVRSVHLFQSALKALHDQKKHTFLLNDFIFHNPQTNRPWESSDWLRKIAWIPLFQKTSVPYRNLYQTRHTFASMMASGGENFTWVSKQMGHETTQTTSRFYVRWLPNPAIAEGYQPVNNW